MKTFGIWTVLFLIITVIISLGFKDMEAADVVIIGLVFSHIMYNLAKDELNEK